MSTHIAGFSGSLSNPSKTRALVDLAVANAATRFGALASTHDLTDLQPSLGQAERLDDLDPLARAIVQTLIDADVLIIGTPVYKGSLLIFTQN
jgi:FMN reductase